MTKEEKMMSIVNHLYWFYNADMADMDNQKDYKNSIEKLTLLIKEEN